MKRWLAILFFFLLLGFVGFGHVRLARMEIANAEVTGILIRFGQIRIDRIEVKPSSSASAASEKDFRSRPLPRVFCPPVQISVEKLIVPGAFEGSVQVKPICSWNWRLRAVKLEAASSPLAEETPVNFNGVLSLGDDGWKLAAGLRCGTLPVRIDAHGSGLAPQLDFALASGGIAATGRLEVCGGRVRMSAKAPVKFRTDVFRFSAGIRVDAVYDAGAVTADVAVEKIFFNYPGQRIAVVDGFVRASNFLYRAGDVPVCSNIAAGWSQAQVRELALTGVTLAAGGSPTNLLIRVQPSIQGSAAKPQAVIDVPLAHPDRLVIRGELPVFAVDPEDALGVLLRKFVPKLDFAGSAGARFAVEPGGGRPYVKIDAEVRNAAVKYDGWEVSDVQANCTVEGRAGRLRTSGRPKVEFGGIRNGEVRFGAGSVLFRMNPDEVFIEKFRSRFAGGELTAHGIHIAVADPDIDFTLYADKVDMGGVLQLIPEFRGQNILGTLYGQMPIRFVGGQVKLTTGFLYSLPGEEGRIAFRTPDTMALLLARAGIGEGAVRTQMAEALHNMSVSMFRIDIESHDPEKALVAFRIKGQSQSKTYPAPIDLTLNLRGPIEQIVNFGVMN